MGSRLNLLAGMTIYILVTTFSIRPVASRSLDQDIIPTGTVEPFTETATFTSATAEQTLPPADPSETATLVSTALPTDTPSVAPTPTPVPTLKIEQKKKRLLVGTTRVFPANKLMAGDIEIINDPIAIELAKIGVTIIEAPADRIDQLKKEFKADPDVRFAEYDGLVQALDVFPNDPGFPSQYGLINIRAPQGWAISTGSSIVTIAVIDSGVDGSHPDLLAKLLPGYDFVESDSVPQDEYGHGTHVSGIAAASTNNGTGVSGVSWGAQILPVRVLDASGNGSYTAVAAGIVWAVDHGAQILNLSLGGVSPNSTLLNAVAYAYDHGTLIIASSGNDGSGNLRYPARYPVVVSVGSTNSINQRSSFSNYGSGLDLMAPGESIFSTNPGGGYGIRTGTSMSTPYVSGLAAILWGMPGFGGAFAIETAMEKSAFDLGSVGWDGEYGYGLIQMDAALLYNPTPPKPQKTHTPPPLYGYYGGPTATPSISPSPTITLTMAITPSITEAITVTGGIKALSTADYSSTNTPTLLVIVSTPEMNAQTGPGRDNLLLLAGSCFVLGGITFIILLVFLRKRQK